MITEAKLCEINALVAQFYKQRATRKERAEIYQRLIHEYGVQLENDGRNHAG